MKKRKKVCLFGLLLMLAFWSCGKEEPRLVLEEEEGSDRETSAAKEGGASDRSASAAAGERGTDGEEAPDGGELLVVYVCGEVNCPGVYELEPGARVYQALEAAGGLTAEADPALVNQAKLLADGEQITVCRTGETPPASAQEQGGLVNLNTADKERLMTLTGIGETRAEAILAYRREHGSFKTTEELMQVDGIKEKTWDKLKEEITV